MTNPEIRIHNGETGEIIDRLMTTAEYTEYKNEIEKWQLEEAAKVEVATAKAALLARLGITADEAKLLLG
jgi:hypothetical protein